MKKTLLESTKILILLALVVFGVGMVHAWTGPASAPPNGNVSAPINVSAVDQSKLGVLGVGGLTSFGQGIFSTSTYTLTGTKTKLLLGINGLVGAKQYCDENGVVCKTIPELGEPGVPSGAVMAFNLTPSVCPTGWTAYTAANGRNIIGTGSATYSIGATSSTTPNYTNGQTGGAAYHKLTVGELANHNHSSANFFTAYSVDKGTNPVTVTYSSETGYTGGDKPHDIRDPFIALLYCKKD